MPPIGIRKYLLEATPESLLAYHARSYTPNNAVYTFVGPFDADFINLIHDRVVEEFGPAQPNEIKNSYIEEPEQEGMRRFVMDGPEMLAIAFRGPAGLERSAYALEVVQTIFNYDFRILSKKGLRFKFNPIGRDISKVTFTI